ncbi:hypothetical protein JCM10212_003088 [Sporobolomyces blumeae]
MARKSPTKRSSAAPASRSSPLSSPEPERLELSNSPGKSKVKAEDDREEKPTVEMTHLSTSAKKKLALYSASLRSGTPFPHWPHPTPLEAQRVCDALASVHGYPQRPKTLVDRPGQGAGCGENPDVLDALVRTILSQNTTSKNSTRAKLSMDERYGRANYRQVLDEGDDALEDAIRCGGLAKQKAKSIMGVLRRLDDKNRAEGKPDGELSLDFLHKLSDEDAMRELISYDLVGIKTASCVLLFCLGRSSFAVDTHVHRLTQALGWLPPNGSVHIVSPDESDPKHPKFTQQTKTTQPPSRDQTFYHLDAKLPDELKYPLHSLLVRHGRGCVKCAANGVTTQDIVDHCPIEDLIVRGKGKRGAKGKARKEVKVENEDGDVVGTVEETEDGQVKVEVENEDDEVKVGRRNKVDEEDKGDSFALEEELGQSRPRSTRASKRAAASRVKYEEDASDASPAASDEDVKPRTKRPRTSTRKSSSSGTLSESLSRSKQSGGATAQSESMKPGRGTTKEKGGMTHSVDRDEAEMSGRRWKDVGEGAMHGMDG